MRDKSSDEQIGYEKVFQIKQESELPILEPASITCLGMTFPNEESRREYFLSLLRNKFKDPEFRNIEGFPIGSDDDILALSDPPYYTACPNPFIEDFIKHYGKPYDPANDGYRREPFAADVSEGKNDPIYNAHSYHTKVPHKAIMRYILHYTNPGDVVFDGFCGTGMTGVAAQLCGDRKTVESLGYKVDAQGIIYQQEADVSSKLIDKPFSKLGARRALLNDLSPAATFIAYNYNTPVDVKTFEREAKRILKEVEDECGWMYKTIHTDTSSSRISGNINYTVWSDVFVCPECSNEVIFWEAAVDKVAGKVHDIFPCPNCKANLSKRNMERAWVTKYDKAIAQTIRQAKQVPVLINYSVGKKRYEKKPDIDDLDLIEKIEQTDIPYWFPTNRMPEGYNTKQPKVSHGITHVHHFYTKRTFHILTAFVKVVLRFSKRALWVATAITEGASKLNRERPLGLPSKLAGTLYVSSMIREINALDFLKRKMEKYQTIGERDMGIISCQSSNETEVPPETIDYIFTDPPFGGNLMYSELNFLWESWLKVFTNNKPEAIENSVQGKGLFEYQRLMTECFKEYYRVLKPGRWMTVEFHNSKNSVWNSIQEALQHAGFVIADIRTLDKQQGSFKQVTSANAVKQDLVISAYKPNGGLEKRFELEAGTQAGVWDFVRTHLVQLPVFVSKGENAEIIVERQNYMLFDRMLAFHVQRGVSVPLSAAEFYAGLVQRFSERDGMFFLPEQVAEYDKKRMSVREVLQLQLVISDESSAIQWLKQQLIKKPQTFQEIHPQFMRELGGWQKHEKPLELSEILEQSFLCYDLPSGHLTNTSVMTIPSQLVSWLKLSEEMRKVIQGEISEGRAREENGSLVFSSHSAQKINLTSRCKDRWYIPDPNKAGDLEKLREKSLLKEFKEYVELASNQRKLKVFRIEAVRTGFRKAWQENDYETIIAVASKIPNNVLEEDPKLLMWYDQAKVRIESE